MNSKTTIGLLVALVIAVVGVWWATTSSRTILPKPTPGPKALFAPPLGPSTGFEFKSGSSPTLVLVNDGNRWRMTSPIACPSDHTKVEADIARISGLQYVKAYPEDDPDRPTSEMTSLDTPLKVLKLTDTDGNSTVLKVGSRQALSKRTYLQKEGDPAIYLVDSDLNADLKRKLADYRAKRVAEFEPANAVRVEVSGEHQYTLLKNDNKWVVETPIRCRADAAKVNTLLRSLSNMPATEFVEDFPKSLRPYGLERPHQTVRVTVETKTPKPPPPETTSQPADPEFTIEQHVLGVSFGGKADDKVFARRAEGESNSVFQVTEAVVAQVVPSLNDVRDKRISLLNTNRATRIVATAGGESVELTKSDNAWFISPTTPVEKPVEAQPMAVIQLLNTVRDLKAIGFELQESPEQGFTEPRATLNITVEAQLQPTRLIIGGLTPSKTGAYVKNASEGTVAVVKAEMVESLIVQPLSFSSRNIVKLNRLWATGIDVQREGITRSMKLQGGSWVFTAPVIGKADQNAAETILNNSTNLKGRRVVAKREDAARFGLAEPIAKVTITSIPPPDESEPTSQSSEGDVLVAEVRRAYLLGKANDKVYAMAEGGQTICEVDAKILADLEVELLDTRVTQMEPTAVKQISVKGAVPFVFEKIGEGWKLVGEPTFAVDATKVSETLDAIRNLRAEKYVKYAGANLAEYGLDKPETALSVTLEDSTKVAVFISPQEHSPGVRFASTSTAPGRVFTVKVDQLKNLQRQVTDFQP